MKNAEERIMKMHERAAEIERRIEKNVVRALSAVSVGLAVCLIVIMQQTQSLHHEIMSASNMGSSLLSSSVGGYVLVAVTAFFLGVILTVLIIRNRQKG